MKEIVLDTETTGISVKDGHRVVEIACLELENLIPTGQKFNYCINPERKVSEKAFEIHGYTDEYLLKQIALAIECKLIDNPSLQIRLRPFAMVPAAENIIIFEK